MKQDYVIQNQLGLHVMPSKRIAQAAEKFECEISLSIGDKKANPRQMIEIIKLGVRRGHTVTLTTEGEDELEAQKVIGELLSRGS